MSKADRRLGDVDQTHFSIPIMGSMPLPMASRTLHTLTTSAHRFKAIQAGVSRSTAGAPKSKATSRLPSAVGCLSSASGCALSAAMSVSGFSFTN